MKLALNVFVFFIPFICAEIINPQKVVNEEKFKQELTVPKTTFSPDSTNFETSSNSDPENLNEFFSLLKNIKINVVAPASDISEEKMEELKNITLLNLNIPKSCFSGNDSELPKTSDEIRFYCLAKAIIDDKSNIIWTIRGGYGSAKIIPYLSKLPKPKIEKYFIGFSDITALHIFFTQKWGWKSIHGNGISEILDVNDKYDEQNFIKIAKIISRKTTVTTISDLIPFNSEAKLRKVIKGQLTGGNLAVIETSLATKWQINAKEKILFLEDVDVESYMIDRSLEHLKQARIFENVKAIIFGTFSNDSTEIIDVLKKFSNTLKIPVFKTNKFGHEKFNYPIIYNTFSQIIYNFNNTYNLEMKI